MSMYYSGLSSDFLSRLTQVNIDLSDANHPDTDLISLRLYEIWWEVWIKIAWWERMTDHGGH